MEPGIYFHRRRQISGNKNPTKITHYRVVSKQQIVVLTSILVHNKPNHFLSDFIYFPSDKQALLIVSMLCCIQFTIMCTDKMLSVCLHSLVIH